MILVFVAYVFIMRPFYYLTVSGETGGGRLLLDSNEHSLAFWSREVGDFNYTLAFLFVSSKSIGLTVYLDDSEVFTKSGTNISGATHGPLPLRLWEGGMESASSNWQAHAISIRVRNLQSERNTVSFTCSLTSYGRESFVYLNVGLVIFGLLIIIATIGQIIYTSHMKRLERLMREYAERT